MADISLYGKLPGMEAYRQQNIDKKLQRELLQNEFELKKQGILRGTNLPAAMQLANDYLKAKKMGDIDRVQALELFAKIYDKGIVSGGMAGGQMGQQHIPQMGSADLPYLEMPEGVGRNDPPPLSVVSGNMPANMPPPIHISQLQPIAIPGYGQAAGSIAATKAGMSKQAEKDVELRMNPQIAGRQETEKLNAKYMEEGRQSLPKMQRALESAQRRNQNIMRVIEQVRKAADGAFRTGFTGSIASAVPGSPAFDLKQNLNTLRANAAFETLQNMRNNSPTGGALGAISERELDLLESAYTNLSNSQSYEQFMQNLAAFEQQNQASLAAAQAAYEQDYQRFGGQNDEFLPPPQAAYEQDYQNYRQQPVQQIKNGTTATNPQTGERIMFDNGQWRKL